MFEIIFPGSVEVLRQFQVISPLATLATYKGSWDGRAKNKGDALTDWRGGGLGEGSVSIIVKSLGFSIAPPCLVALGLLAD